MQKAIPAQTYSPLFWALIPALLATVPIWLSSLPPLADLPQFTAMIRLYDDLRSGHSPFSELFFVDLFTPYLTGYVLVWLLSKTFGLVAAVKIVLSLAVFSMPFSTAWLLWKNKQDPFWCWLTVPVCYGFSYAWGFVNFLLAAPLGMVLIQLTVEHVRQPNRTSAIALILLTHLLFFTHFLCLVFFGGIAGLVAVMQSRGSLRQRIQTLAPLLLILPVGLCWGIPALLTESQAGLHTLWSLGWERITGLAVLAMGTEFSLNFVLIFLALFLLPLLAGARLSRSAIRWLPFGLCLIVVLFAPNWAFGIFFLFQRFAVFLVPLYLLGLEFPPAPAASRNTRLTRLCAVLIGAAWVGLISIRTLGYQAESEEFKPLLTRMQPDRRVLSMVLVPYSNFTTAPIYVHYPAWYQALKGGVADFNFALNYNEPVRYKPERHPGANHNFVWFPGEYGWEAYGGDQYDYFVARGGDDVLDKLPSLNRCEVRMVMRSGSWWLFENTNRAGSSPCKNSARSSRKPD